MSKYCDHKCKCYLRVPVSGVTEEPPKTRLLTTQPSTELEKKIENALVALMDDYYVDWQIYFSISKLRRHIPAILTLIEQAVLDGRIDELLALTRVKSDSPNTWNSV